jgi:uncharacterized iron-regulated protein
MRHIIFRAYKLIMFLAVIVLSVSTASAFSTDDVFRVRDRKMVPLEIMLEELREADIIFVGESHDLQEHHDAQFEIIRALYSRRVDLTVGLEMFLSSYNDSLERWTLGYASEKEFRKAYSEHWDFEWPLYKDIFMFARDERLPMIGLNVSRDIMRKISRNGFESLSDDELYQLPQGISCDIDEKYMEHIRKVYEKHEEGGREFRFFCEAQMVWDKSMALNALKYLRDKRSRTLIVLTGIGHAWKRGIPEQIKRVSDHTYKVVLPEVSDGINRTNVLLNEADFILPLK